MIVVILHRSTHFAIGKTAFDKKVFIKNGDLIRSATVDVVQIESNNRYLIAEIRETFNNEETLNGKYYDDQLIPTNYIGFVHQNIFLIDKKWFFVDNRIKRIVEYILNFPQLWDNSRLLLQCSRKISSRAILFGITFKQAIDKIHSRGFDKARLYCERKKDFSTQGVVAEMLANISSDPEGIISIEIWQGVIDINEVFYAHGILTKDKTKYSHFDCAMINFEISDKIALFEKNYKKKGGAYKKLYRVDGEIDLQHIYNIANRFFPLDHLIDEYFEIEHIE